MILHWIFKNDINKLQKDVVIFTTNTSIILEGQDQPGMVINAGETYWHNTCSILNEYIPQFVVQLEHTVFDIQCL